MKSKVVKIDGYVIGIETKNFIISRGLYNFRLYFNFAVILTIFKKSRKEITMLKRIVL